jgi:hypothetical protein
MRTNDLHPNLQAQYRFVYQPAPERLPRWLLRVWGWF